ncbi:Ig-like domain-containing protein [bacterium]|nr:Ig-like domain-containing protein [bacterium]
MVREGNLCLKNKPCCLFSSFVSPQSGMRVWLKSLFLTLILSSVFCLFNITHLLYPPFFAQSRSSFLNEAIAQQDDGFEENDTYDNPAYIGPGEYFNLQCFDDDWFLVNIPEKGNIKIANIKTAIRFTNGSEIDKNLDLLLYPVTGTEPDYKKDRLDNSELLGNIEVVSASAPPGAYLIHVYGPFGAKNSYDLSVEILYPCQDAPYNWIDIDTGSPPLRLENIGDDDYEAIPIGFDFCFYGQYYDTIRISSNGYLTFSNDATNPNPVKATDKYAPANSIFPYWIDLRPDLGGDVFYKLEQPDADNKSLIVEWRDVPIDACSGGITFQAVLYGGTNRILFQYMDLDFCGPNDGNSLGAGATVGINSERKTKYSDRIATQFSYKEKALNNQSAIVFTPSLEAIPIIPPVVIDTIPKDWESDVALDSEIIIIFDQVMSQDILNECLINPDTNGTWGTKTENGQTVLSFKPNDGFEPNTAYTLTIAGSATSLYYGTGLDGNNNGAPEGTPADDFSFHFTTAAAQVYETDPPVITISGAEDGGFYKGNVDIQIQVSDENPDPNGLSIIFNGSHVSAQSFSVEEDGYHIISVTAYDIFQKTSTASLSFTIDKTPPVITITGVSCGATYNVDSTPVITPVINVYDLNLNVSSLEIKLNGLPYASSQAISELNDYELNVHAADYSGNASSKSCSFSLKTFSQQDGWQDFIIDANCQESPAITALASKIDENGNMWIGYEPYDNGTDIVGGGVCAYNILSGDCECFDKGDGLSGNTVMDIVIGAQGDIWVVSAPDNTDGHGAGVSRYVGNGQFYPYYLNQTGIDEDDLSLVTDIAVDSNGTLWLATACLGLFSFDGVNANNYDVGAFDCINDIMEDVQGRLWIGTCWEGLFVKGHDNPNWNSYPYKGEHLTGSYISGMKKDVNENIWMTSEYGLLRMEPDQFIPDAPNDIPVDPVNPYIIDHNTYYIFVDSGQGIYVYDGQGWTPFSLQGSGIFASEVIAILLDPYGDYWIHSDSRLTHLNSSPPKIADINGQGQTKTNLPIDTKIIVEFSEPMDKKSAEDAFKMKDMVDWDTIQGTFVWNSDSTVMTFVPLNELSYNTSYEISVTETIKDRYGMLIPSVIPSFQVSTMSKSGQTQNPTQTNAQTFNWPYFTGYRNWNLQYPNIFGALTPLNVSNLSYSLTQTDITPRYIQQGTGYYFYQPQTSTMTNYQYSQIPYYSKIYPNLLQSGYYQGSGATFPSSALNISSNIYGSQWDSWKKFLFYHGAYPPSETRIIFFSGDSGSFFFPK